MGVETMDTSRSVLNETGKLSDDHVLPWLTGSSPSATQDFIGLVTKIIDRVPRTYTPIY